MVHTKQACRHNRSFLFGDKSQVCGTISGQWSMSTGFGVTLCLVVLSVCLLVWLSGCLSVCLSVSLVSSFLFFNDACGDARLGTVVTMSNEETSANPLCELPMDGEAEEGVRGRHSAHF